MAELGRLKFTPYEQPGAFLRVAMRATAALDDTGSVVALQQAPLAVGRAMLQLHHHVARMHDRRMVAHHVLVYSLHQDVCPYRACHEFEGCELIIGMAVAGVRAMRVQTAAHAPQHCKQQHFVYVVRTRCVWLVFIVCGKITFFTNPCVNNA